MTSYVDFRLIVTPDLASQGQWKVQVDDCPVPAFIGPKGSIAPTMTRADLNRLRSRNGWPNVQTLKQIGRAAWQSVMTPPAEAAFTACIQTATGPGKGLRLVIILQGDDVGVAGAPAVRLSELPVEAFFTDVMQFIGTDLQTPISRSFQQKPDREAQLVELPLRVLVAVAAPSDRPPANTAQEVQVIKDAVKELAVPGGMLEVEYVEQATRSEISKRLSAKPYHVLHFVGHGGFDIVGDVETPRAYLCFVRQGSTLSDPTDADTLSTMLRNTAVRLVVVTACSSAAPNAPLPNEMDPGPLGTGAFDGVVQRLVTGIAPVTAAVGMQFDLENDAAVEFSKAFYTNLLTPGLPIDEIVTLARRDLIARLEAGHRAWVTPAVYWRCKDGGVFDFDASLGKISDDTLKRIRDLEVDLDTHRTWVAKVLARPPQDRGALQLFLLDWLAKIEALVAERWTLLGEAVTVVGARGTPGQQIKCRLALRMRRAGTIDSVRFQVGVPANVATLASAEPGAETTVAPTTAVSTTGIDVVSLDPGKGASWKVGEHELGFLNLAIVPGAPEGLVDIKVTGVEVKRNGKSARFRGVDGVLFVEGGV